MKRIKVLGPGCPRCEKLAQATKEAADQLGIAYELAKVTDITDITAHGVLMTPGLVVDGIVKLQGRVPGVTEIKDLLTSGEDQ